MINLREEVRRPRILWKVTAMDELGVVIQENNCSRGDIWTAKSGKI